MSNHKLFGQCLLLTDMQITMEHFYTLIDPHINSMVVGSVIFSSLPVIAVNEWAITKYLFNVDCSQICEWWSFFRFWTPEWAWRLSGTFECAGVLLHVGIRDSAKVFSHSLCDNVPADRRKLWWACKHTTCWQSGPRYPLLQPLQLCSLQPDHTTMEYRLCLQWPSQPCAKPQYGRQRSHLCW